MQKGDGPKATEEERKGREKPERRRRGETAEQGKAGDVPLAREPHDRMGMPGRA